MAGTSGAGGRAGARPPAVADGRAGRAGRRGLGGRDVPAPLGGRLTGARAERAARSPQFRDGTFHNPTGTRTMVADPGRNLVRELIFGKQKRRPDGAGAAAAPVRRARRRRRPGSSTSSGTATPRR